MHALVLLAAFKLYGPCIGSYAGACKHPYARIHAPECPIHLEYAKGKETMVIERDDFCTVARVFSFMASGRVIRIDTVTLEPPNIF